MSTPPAKSSFWSSLPGILTGAAGLITALAGAAALILNDKSPDPQPDNPPAHVEQPAGNSAGAPAAPPTNPAAGAARDAPCYAAHLKSIPGDHRKSVNVGTSDVVLVPNTQSKSGVFAVRMNEGNQPIGVVLLTVSTSDETFHIDSVVNARCESVADVANATRAGGEPVLVNWDELRIRMGGNTYLMRLGYSGGEVSVNYFRRIIE